MRMRAFKLRSAEELMSIAIKNRDYEKMFYYYNKNSNPASVVHSIKTRDKYLSRYAIALMMGWKDAIRYFEDSNYYESIGIDENDMTEFRRWAKRNALEDVVPTKVLEKYDLASSSFRPARIAASSMRRNRMFDRINRRNRLVASREKSVSSNKKAQILHSKFGRKLTSGKTVEVDEDSFINMCYERVDNEFSDKFWSEVFDHLSDCGWLSPDKNTPSYIVDNIVINGEIVDIEDARDEYPEIDEKYNGSVEDWVNENDFDIFDHYVVINFGL